MSKLKPTQRGKAGKHRSEDTTGSIKMRARRIVRTANRIDRLLMEQLFCSVNDEPSGLLAGVHDGEAICYPVLKT